ncbi:DUF11 domain-containing protein [Nostoc sp. FACHB-87]|uniref:DUF11 domain-containing protein n=1 Tax=Nostocaceae TaxID=1162 RepID=UPI001682F2CB|nr:MULTISPECIES: DUF11 domain-containing protein [Nostocaceae]MBD2457857.1 DUF11 domain-containing protein [Nostoc sp. FACHB-87]MBD2474607.1 DUF11 domain-containing protein [Anabaena sp. FACHB-83]
MKQIFMAGIGASLLLTTASFMTNLSGVFHWQQFNIAVAQTPQKTQALKLVLVAEKQVLVKDQQGKQKVNWQALKGQAVVQSGDILRYTLTGQNTSDRPLKNLTLNQPIPKGMIYILKSANFTGDAKITYSIDGGSSFVTNPTLKVNLPNGKLETKPAPATAYTHIRLQLPLVAAKTTVKLTYQTQVR